MTASIWIAAAWVVAAAITIMATMAAAWSDAAEPPPVTQAARQDAASLARRDLAASQVCDGRPFEWVDQAVLVCHREVQP